MPKNKNGNKVVRVPDPAQKKNKKGPGPYRPEPPKQPAPPPRGRKKNERHSFGTPKGVETYAMNSRYAARRNNNNLSPAERAGKGGMSGMARPGRFNPMPSPNLRKRPVQPPTRRGMR